MNMNHLFALGLLIFTAGCASDKDSDGKTTEQRFLAVVPAGSGIEGCADIQQVCTMSYPSTCYDFCADQDPTCKKVRRRFGAPDGAVAPIPARPGALDRRQSSALIEASIPGSRRKKNRARPRRSPESMSAILTPANLPDGITDRALVSAIAAPLSRALPRAGRRAPRGTGRRAAGSH